MNDQPKPDPPSRPKRFRFSVGRLIDDFIVLATGQFLAKVFGFLAFAWLARILSVADYGAVETAVGMAAIGAVALELGTGAVGVRRIAQRESNGARVLGSVITARLLLAIVIAPILAVSYGAMTASSMPDMLFWLFAASLFAIPFNHNWYFQSQEKMTIAGFGQTLKMGVFLLAIHFLAPERNGVVEVGYAEVIAAMTMAIWYSMLAFQRLKPGRPHYSVDDGVKLLRESGPLGVSAFVNTVSQYLPLLIVAALADNVETARFAASQRLVVSLITFSFVYYFNLYPLIARRLADDPGALGPIMSASVRVTAWAGVASCAMLWSLAPLVMRLVFGEEFRAAGEAFGLLVWSGGLVLASGNARWLLVAGKRQGSLLAAQCVSAAVILGLCFVLTPSFGAVGAAAASVAGALALWIVVHLRTRGLAVRPGLADNLPAAAAGIAMIGALTILKPDPLIGAAILGAILLAGMVLDARLLQSIKALARAKSAS